MGSVCRQGSGCPGSGSLYGVIRSGMSAGVKRQGVVSLSGAASRDADRLWGLGWQGWDSLAGVVRAGLSARVDQGRCGLSGGVARDGLSRGLAGTATGAVRKVCGAWQDSACLYGFGVESYGKSVWVVTKRRGLSMGHGAEGHSLVRRSGRVWHGLSAWVGWGGGGSDSLHAAEWLGSSVVVRSVRFGLVRQVYEAWYGLSGRRGMIRTVWWDRDGFVWSARRGQNCLVDMDGFVWSGREGKGRLVWRPGQVRIGRVCLLGGCGTSGNVCRA
jgi:hypothetical protein